MQRCRLFNLCAHRRLGHAQHDRCLCDERPEAELVYPSGCLGLRIENDKLGCRLGELPRTMQHFRTTLLRPRDLAIDAGDFFKRKTRHTHAVSPRRACSVMKKRGFLGLVTLWCGILAFHASSVPTFERMY